MPHRPKAQDNDLQFAVVLPLLYDLFPTATADPYQLEARFDSAAVEGRFHDLTDVFEGHPGNLVIGGCHFLPEGNRILADRIYESMR